MDNIILKVLGGWDYTPEFAGNKNMVITFKRLSGSEELNILQNSDDTNQREQLFIASIEKITNPMKLENAKGIQKDVTPEDICKYGELKGLFYELISEYAKQGSMNGDALKK